MSEPVACNRKGCAAPARFIPQIHVPLVGIKADDFTCKIEIRLELCAAHFEQLDLDEMFTPEFKKLFDNINAMSARVHNRRPIPLYFPGKFARRLSLNHDLYKQLAKAAAERKS